MFFSIQISILNDAKILEHQDILSQFAHVESNLEFVAKEVRYHSSCRNSFANLARAKKLNREKEERLERDRRGNSERHTIYTTLGKKQKRPSNFLNALRSDSFKVEFVKLLVASFGDASLANILGIKKLYVTEGQSCFSFTTLNDEILRKEETEMTCFHEEADTRVSANLLYSLIVTCYTQYYFLLIDDCPCSIDSVTRYCSHQICRYRCFCYCYNKHF